MPEPLTRVEAALAYEISAGQGLAILGAYALDGFIILAASVFATALVKGLLS